MFTFFFILDGAGTNKQHITTKNTAKLDRETEELKHDKIPLDVGKLIMQGRQSKGLSQKDLATVSTYNFGVVSCNFNKYIPSYRKFVKNNRSSRIMKQAEAFLIT